jgi:hypothetical protein
MNRLAAFGAVTGAFLAYFISSHDHGGPWDWLGPVIAGGLLGVFWGVCLGVILQLDKTWRFDHRFERDFERWPELLAGLRQVCRGTCPFADCGVGIANGKFACDRHWSSLSQFQRELLSRALQEYLNEKIGVEELKRVQQEVLATAQKGREGIRHSTSILILIK